VTDSALTGGFLEFLVSAAPSWPDSRVIGNVFSWLYLPGLVVRSL